MLNSKAVLNIFIFIFGVSLQFDPIVSELGLPFLRASDAFAPFLFLWVLYYLVRDSGSVRNILLVTGILAIVSTAFALKYYPEQGDAYPVIMFVAYAGAAFVLVKSGEDNERAVYAFCIGSIIGFVASLIILFVQSTGYQLDSSLVPSVTSLKGSDALYNSRIAKDKPGGMWGEGNSAGHAYSLVASCAVYIAYRINRSYVYILFFLAILTASVLTKNRAGLIAPAIIMLYMLFNFWRFRDRLLILMLTAPVLVLAVSLPLMLPDSYNEVIRDRTVNDSNINQNIGERAATSASGLSLVIRYPFGVGYRERGFVMLNTTGNRSLHNAFFSVAADLGLFALLLFICGALRILLFVREPFALTATLVTLSSSFFEELGRLPPYQFFFCFVMVRGLIGLRRSYFPGENKTVPFIGRREADTGTEATKNDQR